MQRQSPTADRTFRLIDVEQDVEEALRRSPPLREPQPIDYAPPDVRLPTPADVGKLSAEAVAKGYELAALEIEKMGNELKERTRLCEQLVIDSNEALALVQETAAQFRDAGKAISLRIEDASAMTTEVRQTCGALTSKIAGPSS